MSIQSHRNQQNFLNRFSKSLILCVLIGFICIIARAQGYENLSQLNGHATKVYFTPGSEMKAKRIAGQLDKVIAFYNKRIQFSPSVTLLILSSGDWNKYSKSVVYGMPHYTDNKTLIVASENNDFWNSFIPPLDKMPDEYASQIRAIYADKKGGLTMEPFFDLLAIHELGHAYHIQDSLLMQRNWMGELFVNIFLHSYIAENEPGLLPALTMFPKMVVSTTDRATLKHTTLKDLETFYNELAQKHPRNYGWYQCRWHVAAENIYNKAGLPAFEKLWLTLKAQREILDDPSFATMLSEKVDQSVANVQLEWDNLK